MKNMEKNRDGLYKCCANLKNRKVDETANKDLQLEVCNVCGRRHFTLSVDTGVFVTRDES